ncbi:MAG: TonB-dependent receptor [Acidobacteria bacterium]|nr:TonB-dependent receptor [Acidobacteriota bacterium]
MLRKMVCLSVFFSTLTVLGQGVTVGSLSGTITDASGGPLPGAVVTAELEASGTRYSAVSQDSGHFFMLNMRVGGPYTVTVTMPGFQTQKRSEITVRLGENLALDFEMSTEAIAEEMVVVISQDELFDAEKTGAATSINEDQVIQLPSIKRSTRDLTRVDPRSDGNMSFGGRNWLYNNMSLDGSYFNNPFGLDDPAPGGQTNAEPVPFDAIEQVHVSVAPFDVREGGFTGAGINSVTRSGTNQWSGSIYTFQRSEDTIGDEVNGVKVLNPNLDFQQTGVRIGGPIIKDKLFFFANGELVRRDDPGSNFLAARPGLSGSTVSRVSAEDLDTIRQRMIDVYNYDPGAYENYVHATDNDKFILKFDWNVNADNTVSFRYSRLDATRDLPPHPFAISINNTGRGPNENSLPFQNAGYAINNKLDSYALEWNSQFDSSANRFFLSYNRFRDFRTPFSRPFPTIEIGVDGVTYTTLGHEPFSIHNILDQDVIQLTDNFSYFADNHVITVGTNFETFEFFNSFNLFFHGLFPAPAFVGPEVGGTTFFSVAEFLDYTDPNSPNFRDFNAEVDAQLQNPFKGDDIELGQFAIYAQDDWRVSGTLNLTYGLRVDFPIYFTDLESNAFTQSLTLLDENGNPETIDAGQLPDTGPLFSPRIGFNWDIKGDATSRLRGGTGIFTGRLPFVWIGNTISNQGPTAEFPSFDINATDPDFEWPQIWTTNLALDHQLPMDFDLTVEGIYGKDINAIYVRNANLAAPIGRLPGPDGRTAYDPNNNQLNDLGGGGVYVLDNTSDGSNFNITTQVHKRFKSGLQASLAYAFLEAKNQLSSTEIASFLWQFNAVKGNPNKPEVSYSEFGNRHRIVGTLNYRHQWNNALATSVGVFFEAAEGSFSTAGRRSRYSYVYAGDVNGDGQGGNDLIYIPNGPDEINFDPILDDMGNVVVTADEQWAQFNAFIEQDSYLRSHRGQIADRFGASNPWFNSIDVRILQDLGLGNHKHTFQLSLDILNLGNLINSDWGVREVANTSATTPLVFTRYNDAGEPVFIYPGTTDRTFVDDVSVVSRWQAQLGIRYTFQ